MFSMLEQLTRIARTLLTQSSVFAVFQLGHLLLLLGLAVLDAASSWEGLVLKSSELSVLKGEITSG